MVLFFAKHALALALVLLAAAGAGTLATGSRLTLPLRAALGLALWAQSLFFLGLIGQLRVWTIVAMLLIAIGGGALRGLRIAIRHLPSAIFLAPLFILALFPPLAFDETLYHLPFVRELATSGQLHFVPEFRFPVFPQLQELLCAPLYLLVGDTATHLVSLAEIAIAAAILLEWDVAAAAFFLGSPIVLHLGTIGYVDAALALFVTAGFHCLAREEHALSGFFFGTACGVKYLGGFFAVAGLAIARRWRFLFALLAGALPTTLWLFFTTGNPVFPFFGSSPWALPAAPFTFNPRLLWDVTFARDRMVNVQPPITPLLIVAIVGVTSNCLPFRRKGKQLDVTPILLITVAYLVAYCFLPQDSRYLVPLLPLLAIAFVGRPKWVAWIAIAPGVAYLAYRLAIMGLPPTNAAEREQFLTQRVPEYAALMRAGDARVYVCGAEQLKYYARGQLLGDHNGPYSFDRVFSSGTIPADYLLVSKRVCRERFAGLALVYEDANAQLWRIPKPR